MGGFARRVISAASLGSRMPQIASHTICSAHAFSGLSVFYGLRPLLILWSDAVSATPPNEVSLRQPACSRLTIQLKPNSFAISNSMHQFKYKRTNSGSFSPSRCRLRQLIVRSVARSSTMHNSFSFLDSHSHDEHGSHVGQAKPDWICAYMPISRLD